jgi:ribosomal peptide maturation radical SAM protein 1
MNSHVALVTMPWGQPTEPSLVMGTLHSVLERCQIPVASYSYHLAFAEYLANNTTSEGHSFGLGDYQDMIGNFGLGEWIFAISPFRESSPTHDGAYLDYLRKTGQVPERHIAMAKDIRPLVPEFIEACVNDVLSANPSVIVMLPMYREIVPSLLLALRIKQTNPGTKIVFAGPVCDGDIGEILVRSFSFIDAIVRGDPENILVEVIRDCLQGALIRSQPGLCYRSTSGDASIENTPPPRVSVKTLPTPNYDEYFARLHKASLSSRILWDLWISYESSRGCWKAEKEKCHFCALTQGDPYFRSKDPEVVFNELVSLSKKSRFLKFHVFDWITDPRSFTALFPKIRSSQLNFLIYLQVRATLEKEQLRILRSAGVVVQVGIESLSTPILQLMNKGTTTLTNIRVLKWCAELGLRANWNIIFNIPGEPEAEYEKMANLVKKISHLSPPDLARFRLQRFSNYFRDSSQHPLKVSGPMPWYQHVFSMLGPKELSWLAEEFEFEQLDGRTNVMSYTQPLREAIASWKQHSSRCYRGLKYQRGPGFIAIIDERPGTPAARYVLEELEAEIYLACDAGADPETIHAQLLERGAADFEPESIREFLDQLVEANLMYEEDGAYLSLAIAEDGNIDLGAKPSAS